ncbi:MAG: lipocalin family protein [Gallionella sp.]|nr:lipocalin family protein [Gallionella sp.]
MKKSLRLSVLPLLTALLLGLSGCDEKTAAPLATASQVDLSRYLGKWYEIAMIPNRFQSMCVSDTQAIYELRDEMIRVHNRCRTRDGKFEDAKGVAKIVADSGNAKLRVSFFRPFYGDYWILALDPDYQWVLVGEPTRTYSWILSRQPNLPDATLQSLLERAEALGFPRASYVLTRHTSASQ